MADPWMKFYPADWRSDPRLKMVSRSARSLWLDMICLMHEAERYGDLTINGQPLDAAKLAAVVGDSVDDVSVWLQELADAGVYSVRKNGTIYSRRMERDENKRRKNRENGKKGGVPSHCKNREIDKSVNRKPNPTEARSQKPDTRDKKQKASPSSKKGSRLSADWTPSEKNLSDAHDTGLPPQRIRQEADKFRDYWISKPGQGGVKLDWDATWRNWCRNASSRQPATRHQAPTQSLQELFSDELGDGDGRGCNVVAFGGRS